MKKLLLLLSLAAAACSTDHGGGNSGGVVRGINGQVHDLLLTNYLWNEEYASLSTSDALWSMSYREFFRSRLLSMSTNTLDKKRDQNGNWKIYSYINRLSSPSGRSTRAIDNGVEKNKTLSYGFYNFDYATIGGRNVFTPHAVYADSPAARAGIGRATRIVQVNQTALSDGTVDAIYNQLMGPAAAGQTVELTDLDGKVYKLQAEALYENPVAAVRVFDKGAHKIGYMAYLSFNAAFDQEVLDAFTAFRQAGITDLVLDFRVNGGGHVMSAGMIAACVAGPVSNSKVLEYYRFNNARMATPETTSRATGLPYDSGKQRFYELFPSEYYGVDLSTYALSLPRLHVIGTYMTASASEMVIHSLRGIGLDVRLVGQRTNGKNVGMEATRINYESSTYEVVPITFQGYNALMETVDPDGLTPDVALDTMAGPDGNNREFGDEADPALAACLAEITGAPALKMRAAASISRVSRPFAAYAPRNEGMIRLN